MMNFKDTIGLPVIRKDTVLEAIEKSPARSAWAKGVKNYAYDLLYDFDDDTNCARLTGVTCSVVRQIGTNILGVVAHIATTEI